jgi:hypothetical protein
LLLGGEVGFGFGRLYAFPTVVHVAHCASNLGGYFFRVIVDDTTNGGRYPRFMAISNVDSGAE